MEKEAMLYRGVGDDKVYCYLWLYCVKGRGFISFFSFS
jgi:hypothetical protein